MGAPAASLGLRPNTRAMFSSATTQSLAVSQVHVPISLANSMERKRWLASRSWDSMAACDLAFPGLRRFTGLFRMSRRREYRHVDVDYITPGWQALFHRPG